MAIGIDTSKWKPRKISGTPAGKFGSAIAIGSLLIGAGCGFYFHNASITQNLRQAAEKLYEDPIEEVERRLLIASGLPNRTGDQIRALIDGYERPDRPDK